MPSIGEKSSDTNKRPVLHGMGLGLGFSMLASPPDERFGGISGAVPF